MRPSTLVNTNADIQEQLTPRLLNDYYKQQSPKLRSNKTSFTTFRQVDSRLIIPNSDFQTTTADQAQKDKNFIIKIAKNGELQGEEQFGHRQDSNNAQCMTNRLDSQYNSHRINALNKPEKAPFFILKNINELKKEQNIKHQNGRKYMVKTGLQQRWRSITPTAYITNDRASKNEILPMNPSMKNEVIKQQWSQPKHQVHIHQNQPTFPRMSSCQPSQRVRQQESNTMLSSYAQFLQKQGLNKIKDFRAFQIYVQKRSDQILAVKNQENLFATVQENYQTQIQNFKNNYLKLPQQNKVNIMEQSKISQLENMENVSTLGSLLKSPKFDESSKKQSQLFTLINRTSILQCPNSNTESVNGKILDREVSKINKINESQEKPRLKKKSTLSIINDKIIHSKDELDRIEDSVYDDQKQETVYIDKQVTKFDDIENELLQKQFQILSNGQLLIDQIKSDEHSNDSSHISKILIYQQPSTKNAVKTLNLNQQIFKRARQEEKIKKVIRFKNRTVDFKSKTQQGSTKKINTSKDNDYHVVPSVLKEDSPVIYTFRSGGHLSSNKNSVRKSIKQSEQKFTVQGKQAPRIKISDKSNKSNKVEQQTSPVYPSSSMESPNVVSNKDKTIFMQIIEETRDNETLSPQTALREHRLRNTPSQCSLQNYVDNIIQPQLMTQKSFNQSKRIIIQKQASSGDQFQIKLDEVDFTDNKKMKKKTAGSSSTIEREKIKKTDQSQGDSFLSEEGQNTIPKISNRAHYKEISPSYISIDHKKSLHIRNFSKLSQGRNYKTVSSPFDKNLMELRALQSQQNENPPNSICDKKTIQNQLQSILSKQQAANKIFRSRTPLNFLPQNHKRQLYNEEQYKAPKELEQFSLLGRPKTQQQNSMVDNLVSQPQTPHTEIVSMNTRKSVMSKIPIFDPIINDDALIASKSVKKYMKLPISPLLLNTPTLVEKIVVPDVLEPLKRKNLVFSESEFELKSNQKLNQCLQVNKMKQDENIYQSMKYNNQMIKNGSTVEKQIRINSVHQKMIQEQKKMLFAMQNYLLQQEQMESIQTKNIHNLNLQK